MKNIKVLLVSTEYPPHIFGGGGIFAYNLVQGLQKHGVNVTVLTMGYNDTSYAYNNDSVKKLLVKSPDKPPRHVWFQIYGKKIILETIRKDPPDIIHANSFSAGLLFRVLATKYPKIPRIVTVHGYPRHYLHLSINSMKYTLNIGQLTTYVVGYPSWECILRLELKHSNRIVTVAKFIKDSIIQDYNINDSKVIYIPNGINVDNVLNNVKTCKFKITKNNNYIIVSGGRLFYEKGHILLIYAIKMIINKGLKDIHLYIFGDGPFKPLLEKKIREYNLHQYVKLLGKVPHKEALCIMSKADVIVIPSLYEVMPMLVLEAIALKRPVVLLYSRYVNELLNLNMRFEIAYSITDLANKITSLLNDEKYVTKRHVEHNYSILRKYFDIDVMVRQYMNLYSELIR